VPPAVAFIDYLRSGFFPKLGFSRRFLHKLLISLRW